MFQDLLKFVQSVSADRPVLICGDFNAEPNEPVYSTMINSESFDLSSAYADVSDPSKVCELRDEIIVTSTADGENGKSRAEQLMHQEPPFTTWKIREEGEVCHTIDYVFYSRDKLKVIANRLLYACMANSVRSTIP